MRAAALLLFAVISFSAGTAKADESAAISKLISEIDTAAKTDKARMMSLIVINTDVSRETLEREKTRTGFTLGEVYVAHSIALASKRTFSQIVAMKAGRTWAQVAQKNKVSLRGASASITELMRRARGN